MLDHEPDMNNPSDEPAGSSASGPGPDQPTAQPPRRRRAASRPAGPPSTAPDAPPIEQIVVAEPVATPEPVAPEPVAPEAVTPEPAAPELPVSDSAGVDDALPVKKPARKAAAKRPAKKAAVAPEQTLLPETTAEPAADAVTDAESAPAPRTRAPRKRAPRKVAAPVEEAVAETPAAVPEPVVPEPAAVPEPELTALDESPLDALEQTEAEEEGQTATVAAPEAPAPSYAISFSAGPLSSDDLRTDALKARAVEVPEVEDEEAADADDESGDQGDQGDDEAGEDESGDDNDSRDGGDGRRRRRRRGGRRRRRTGGEDDRADAAEESSGGVEEASAAAPPAAQPDAVQTAESTAADHEGNGDDSASDEGDSEGDSESDGSRRRRRRRRRRGEDSASAPDDPTEVVVRVREPRRSAKSGGSTDSSGVTGIEGSTRMEAKRQRRRDGREAGRRRAPILSEAEFLARRESVSRKMIIRQADDLSQIAVLEDDILVEHYVDRDSAASLIGNVYLGRVQNVLPSMEAAFIDIGRGRNAVLYAGEVDWDSFGAEGQGRKVERVLKSGQTILVQVTKDPVGAKGARLTNHVSIPGRYIVYAPSGHLSGISRKLPDTERKRLKDILSDLIGEASVIVRTAAEGASEDELVRDVNRLKAQWAEIEKRVKAGQSPQLLYGEPDLTVRIVRDLFTEDFSELIIQGNGAANDAYDAVDAYVTHVAPHLKDRLRGWNPAERGDLFAEYRLDEQIAKGLERKVFLPSGGSLVIDRTEAMTVIDVNTGKFTGSGGNLEATVTSNNLEAAEEIVNQLRLRDVGGIIVIDFIDMVLPANRELLLRRLVECLGRDRTRHQVAEVTSLGLVQMTRKKIGTGLAEAFTTECPTCHGRGVEIHDLPVDSQRQADGGARDGGRRDQRRGGGGSNGGSSNGGGSNGGGSNGGSSNGGSSNGSGNSAPSPTHRSPMPPELRPHHEPESRPEPQVEAEPETASEPQPVTEPAPEVEPAAAVEPAAEVELLVEAQTETVVPEPEVPKAPTRRRRATRQQGAPTAADPQAAPASDPQGEPVPAS